MSNHDLRRFFRQLFYRFEAVRIFAGLISIVSGRTRSIRTSHLNTYLDEDSTIAVQAPEALLLNALVQITLPNVIVEFGFARGHSAFNFLRASPSISKLYSFDISDDSLQRATKEFANFPNFKFIAKSQTEFSSQDIDGHMIDFLFLDAAHHLDLNKATWERVLPFLNPQALVVVHDTGTWNASLMTPKHDIFVKQTPHGWLGETEFQHQQEERQFVNWILKVYPDFAAIHCHSLNALRHGLTILQRQKVLPT